MEIVAMPSPFTPAAAELQKKRKGASFHNRLERLFSPEHFHFKLLLGTAVGILVIVLLAVTCIVLTFRNQRRDRLRSHTVEVLRLSSVVENDIAAFENAYRGYLLTREGVYLESFNRRQGLFQWHSEELTTMMWDNSTQRKRILKMRESVQNWLNASAQPASRVSTQQKETPLAATVLNQARDILQTIQREEQIVLNQRVREREWAVQSVQVLNFIPKLQRAAYEMQKETRGYLLTGDPTFIESYKRATSDFYTYQGHLSILVANARGEMDQLNLIRERIELWITQCALPDIEAKRAGEDMSDPARSGRSESVMNDVRRLMDDFEKEQINVYKIRAAAAARERILAAAGIDLLCVLAAGLMVGSSSYSFVIYRRQLKKLESADNRIRSVIDHVLDGMVTLDKEGAVYSMNPAAKRMFGYGENDFFGDAFTQLVPKFFEREFDNAPVTCDWPRFAQRTGGTTLALAQTRGCAIFPVEISLSEMIVDQERFYVAMVRDITERKRFEEEIAAEKKSLAITLGSIGDGVITTDLNARITVFNPACEAMTGWPTNEALGQPLRTVFRITADAAAQNCALRAGYRSEAEAILLGMPERSTLTSRTGTERVIEQVASPIRDAKNDLCGVVLVFRDITQRQRDEAERRKAETLDQLGLLAGGIAHDFNNLLTAIIGNISLASLLLQPNDQMIERLDDAKNASLRARDLAQQLLTFARGGAPIKKTASVAKLIEDTVSFSLRGSHSRSEFVIAPELWPAEFDAGQISQVIANLVVNADQAMPEGGILRIGCDNFSYSGDSVPAVPELAAGDYIRIKVGDQGVGIPENFLKQIFDPYFTTKPKGNGLGLATAYSVIKNHNGLITVESEQHSGSTFTIYLPAGRQQSVAEPVALTSEPAAASPEPITGSGRILIVDDEEAIRALVDFTLTRLGYEVAEAGTALQGVELYRSELARGRRYDLVILDLTLPGGMGGKEALKKLLEIDPTVNAMVSSGYATDATMSRYQDFGFRGVIAKPYEASELGQKVHDVIQSSQISCEADYELERAC